MKKMNFGLVACGCLLALSACSDKTAGVTEDDNAFAQGGSCSSSVDPSSSGAADAFNLWDGSGEYRVNTGNKKTGYWFSVSDGSEGGMSLVKYPAEVGKDGKKAFDAVIDYCEGVCGTVELKNPVATPWAGIGFSVAEEGSSADISAWGGLCITYASDMAMNVMLGIVTAGDTLNWASPSVSFPKTVKSVSKLGSLVSSGKSVTRCAQWSDFKIPVWANTGDISQVGPVLAGDDASKQVHAVLFRFTGSSSQVANFNIKGIGSYDEELPQWDDPVELITIEEPIEDPIEDMVSKREDMSKCLWYGPDADYSVNTGIDSGDGAGNWYSFNDNSEKGKSFLTWIEDGAPQVTDGLEPVIDACGGLCGVMHLGIGGASEAYVGVGFNVAGLDSTGSAIMTSITDWGGICVTYTAESDMQLVLGALRDKWLPLEKSLQPVEKCYNWDDFNIASAKDVYNIRVEMRSTESFSAKFNIIAVGKYSRDGACTQITSSSSKVRSSSSTTSSSSVGTSKNTAACLWKGTDEYGPVKTGFDPDDEYGAGYWYNLGDNDDGGQSTVAFPVGCDDQMDEWQCTVALVELCNGYCADLALDKGTASEAYAGFGFNVAGVEDPTLSNPLLGRREGDISGWGGICVTYAADREVYLELDADSTGHYETKLDKSTDFVETCVTWSAMKAAEASKHARSIKFKMKSVENITGYLNIAAIGKYDETGACEVEGLKPLTK